MLFIILGLLLITLSLIIMYVCMWKMYEKAAIPGWYSLIPFANIYMIYKMAKLPGWLYIAYFIIPGTQLLLIYAYYRMAKNFNVSTFWSIAGLFILGLTPCMIAYGTYEYNF